MHYLYIIYSSKTDRYYCGHSANVEKRLEKHNRGHSLSTKSGVPWQLMKVFPFDNKSTAIKAENWIKRMKSRKLIEQIIRGEKELYKMISG